MSVTWVVIGALAGLLLGMFFFGTLWLTVSRIRTSRHPAALMLGSFLLRLAVVGAGFYAIATRGGWEGVVAAVAGVLASRVVLVRRLGPRTAPPLTQQDSGHGHQSR